MALSYPSFQVPSLMESQEIMKGDNLMSNINEGDAIEKNNMAYLNWRNAVKRKIQDFHDRKWDIYARKGLIKETPELVIIEGTFYVKKSYCACAGFG